ncbi:methyltransferase [Fusarium albosuccineum]|uniref:Methyltransferase n=1 Tax=Fusarium albosuccineum TaxID=1237068 RepID=A0A8H4L5X0_9HYPO|nr:methyltransferase [Fusarium albosuccineum]
MSPDESLAHGDLTSSATQPADRDDTEASAIQRHVPDRGDAQPTPRTRLVEQVISHSQTNSRPPTGKFSAALASSGPEPSQKPMSTKAEETDGDVPRDKHVPGQRAALAEVADASLSQEKRRPMSLIVSPLTHPNGVSMFPDLSTTEQEDLSLQALTQAEDNIIADSDEFSTAGDTSDGGYESDSVSSASTSVGSSVRNYMYENGRRYHKFREGTYNFPNEDVEQEREDMKHAMVKLLCSQKLHFAPIGSHPQNVLDVGTGTGIWAIEMGDQYSSATVLGIDLSPIQPDWLPPNVRFMVDDVESPWLHPGNHFDYIHSRHTVMAIKDWPRLFQRSLEHLKPGGWIELQEIHHYPHSAKTGGVVAPDAHPVAQYWSLITQGLAAVGVNFHAAAGGDLAAKMRQVGFVNVTERVFHVPIGTWPKNKVLKTVGLYWRTILSDGLQAIAMGPLTRGLGWDREQVEVLLVNVRRAYNDNSALLYMPMHIIYGQKPY